MLLGSLGVFLGYSWGALGVLRGLLGCLGALLGPLEPSWGALGAPVDLEHSPRALGALMVMKIAGLELIQRVAELLGALLGLLKGLLGRRWVLCAISWEALGAYRLPLGLTRCSLEALGWYLGTLSCALGKP